MFDLRINMYIVDTLLRYILYGLLFMGVWILVYPLIMPSFSARRSFIRSLNLNNKQVHFNSVILKHLQRLLSITLGLRSNYAVLSFLILYIVLFALTFSFCLKLKFGILSVILYSLLVAGLPYGFLYIWLNSIRVSASYEGLPLVTELSNNYKIYYLNMIEAIDASIPSLKRQPYTKKALSRMALRLKQYRNAEELDDIIQEFNFSINTQWSMNLSNAIYLAILYGYDVTESLNDILDDLGVLKKIVETDKQFNNEAFLIMKYGGPLFYIITVWSLFKFFNFSLKKFIDYQFINPIGLRWFMYIVLAIIVNYIVFFMVRKPKNDF